MGTEYRGASVSTDTPVKDRRIRKDGKIVRCITGNRKTDGQCIIISELSLFQEKEKREPYTLHCFDGFVLSSAALASSVFLPRHRGPRRAA